MNVVVTTVSTPDDGQAVAAVRALAANGARVFVAGQDAGAGVHSRPPSAFRGAVDGIDESDDPVSVRRCPIELLECVEEIPGPELRPEERERRSAVPERDEVDRLFGV